MTGGEKAGLISIIKNIIKRQQKKGLGAEELKLPSNQAITITLEPRVSSLPPEQSGWDLYIKADRIHLDGKTLSYFEEILQQSHLDGYIIKSNACSDLSEFNTIFIKRTIVYAINYLLNKKEEDDKLKIIIKHRDHQDEIHYKFYWVLEESCAGIGEGISYGYLKMHLCGKDITKILREMELEKKLNKMYKRRRSETSFVQSVENSKLSYSVTGVNRIIQEYKEWHRIKTNF